VAKVKSIGTVDVELTVTELSLIRRALKLVHNFGGNDDMDPARDLLADLASVSDEGL
jgi:hypothetical protein